MRRGVLAFILVNVALITYLVFSVWTLISLLLVDGSEDAISRAELPSPESEDQFGGKRQLIPKIIHQTYANASIPSVWEAAQQSCIDLHPDYEYRLWTDESAREFIAAEYMNHTASGKPL
jgi:inositol phosphorylceramide mannosyltransferase catalytic subunit